MTARNNPQAVSVTPLKDYKLAIVFENNERRIFDVSPYIKGNWFGELADDNYFKTVRIAGESVEWADGQDICPDDLYEDSVAI